MLNERALETIGRIRSIGLAAGLIVYAALTPSPIPWLVGEVMLLFAVFPVERHLVALWRWEEGDDKLDRPFGSDRLWWVVAVMAVIWFAPGMLELAPVSLARFEQNAQVSNFATVYLVLLLGFWAWDRRTQLAEPRSGTGEPLKSGRVMAEWGPSIRVAVVILMILAYEWMSPMPVNRWAWAGLMVAGVIPFERLLIRRGAGVPTVRPLKFTPRVFWAVAALVFVAFAIYEASPLLARHPEDASLIRGAFFLLLLLGEGVIRDRG